MKFSLSKLIYSLMMLLLVVSPALADDLSDIQAKIADLQNKINAAKSQENTLSSQIGNLNNQIQLTQYQIDAKQKALDQKEAELTILSSDITDVSGRISNIETNLNNLARIAAKRVRVSQAIADAAPMETLFVSGNFQQASTNLTYTEYIQRKDKEVFDDMLALKGSLGVQKTTLQDKQAQVVQLRDEIKSDRDSLSASQNQLASQKYAKQTLLSQTQNSESNYKRLLDQARSQEQSLLAFSRARLGSGGSIVAHESLSDGYGAYYNQRDAWWGNIYIGYSSEQIWAVGCLITSMAMVFSHYGYNSSTPGVVGANPANFFSNTAYMWNNVAPPGHSSSYYYRPSSSFLSSQLASGHAVILGLSFNGGPVSDHWVVLRNIVSGQYYINDPWYENNMNVPLGNHYAGVVINEARVIN